MSEFGREVQSIIEAIAKANDATAGKGIEAEAIAGIVHKAAGEPINCYPGTPGKACHSKSYFISLSGMRHASGRRHLGFKGALAAFERHMLRICRGKTHYAIIIVDTWDSAVFEQFRPVIKQVINGGSYAEVFLVHEGTSYIEIPI